jgi:hypothetical protein
MSLGRPTPASARDPDQLFQILTGIYDELQKRRLGESALNQRILSIVNNISDISIAIGSPSVPQPPPGMQATDEDAPESLFPGIPGPQGKPGRDGAALIPTDEDTPDPAPLIVPPPRDPFVLHLGYGPTNFDGTLPSFAEGNPHFWLHPYTWLSNVSALIIPSTHNDMPIEWEVGGSYTRAELDFFVRDCGLSTDGTGTPTVTATISKNGSDSSVTDTIASGESNVRHHVTGALSVTDGDKVGIHIACPHMGSGSLIAHFIARLT